MIITFYGVHIRRLNAKSPVIHCSEMLNILPSAPSMLTTYFLIHNHIISTSLHYKQFYPPIPHLHLINGQVTQLYAYQKLSLNLIKATNTLLVTPLLLSYSQKSISSTLRQLSPPPSGQLVN